MVAGRDYSGPNFHPCALLFVGKTLELLFSILCRLKLAAAGIWPPLVCELHSAPLGMLMVVPLR